MTLRTWTALIACLPAAACFIGEPGNGVSTTETLDLRAFDGLHLTNQIDVSIVEGEAIAGEVTCDENLLDNLRFEVRDGILVIDTPLGREIRPFTSCFAEITAVGLQSVQLSGSGNLDVGDFAELSRVQSSASGDLVVDRTRAGSLAIELSGSGNVDVVDAPNAQDVQVDAFSSGDVQIDGLLAEVVAISMGGSGDVTLSGETARIDLSIGSSGNLQARDLATTDAEVELSASGTADIFATGLVSGRLSGSGDLIVRGPATIDVRTSGSGSVRTR